MVVPLRHSIQFKLSSLFFRKIEDNILKKILHQRLKKKIKPFVINIEVNRQRMEENEV